jgi:hypothetical protein
MQQSEASYQSGRRLAWRSLEFIAPYKLAVAGIIGLALVLSVIGAADPLVLKYLFDALGRGERMPVVYALAALLGIEIARSALATVFSPGAFASASITRSVSACSTSSPPPASTITRRRASAARRPG